ncbi:DedA family protein [Candidatus Bandiella euplotis]|nr:DedA family protein [Candidatus Bandiella woodruffii]
MTLLESTFLPIPSELTLIPAGYLISKGTMHVTPTLFASVTGTLLGSLINYMIAYYFGRKLFINYGKYFFIKPGQLHSLELFFNKYGAVSTFFGRMLPGIKHFISFPAGLARMNIRLFCTYTVLGSFIWVSFLLYLGRVIDENEELISKYISRFNFFIIFIVVLTIILAYTKGRNKKKR